MFQAANEWTVFYLAYPEGEWMHMPATEWQQLARPISIDSALVAIDGVGLKSTPLFPIGMCVRHNTHGDGYVTRHDRESFEVCFFGTGPKVLKASTEQEKLIPISGIGERWPARVSARQEPEKVRPPNERNVKAAVSRNPPASLAPDSPKHPVRDENGESRPPLVRGGLSLKAAPMLELEQDSSSGVPSVPPTLPKVDGRPCTCSGSNENCKRCFGSGWIGPTDTAHTAVPAYCPRSTRNRRKRSRRGS